MPIRPDFQVVLHIILQYFKNIIGDTYYFTCLNLIRSVMTDREMF